MRIDTRGAALTTGARRVRRAEIGDSAAIHEVVKSCFPTDSEARLVDLLREAGRLTLSLVAEVEGSIVGHVAFSPVSAASGARGVGLAPVSVREGHRRRGLAGQLIERGLAECKSMGFRWAVVLGEPAYYGRFGFCAGSAFGLEDEYGGGEAFQALALMAGGLEGVGGLVRYSPEFAMVG